MSVNRSIVVFARITELGRCMPVLAFEMSLVLSNDLILQLHISNIELEERQEMGNNKGNILSHFFH